MDLMDLIRTRHSVRQFSEKTVPPRIRAELDSLAGQLNRQGSLHIQILYDEPLCFGSRMAHYGSFENCRNYIVMAGKKAPDLQERCGYFGELLVLKAQELGLNTCWAALTRGKSRASLGQDEAEVIVIALGYGKTQGRPHRSKSPEAVSNLSGGSPDWFRRGIEAALLAPTAINQQKFRFTLTGRSVSVKEGLVGPCLKTDLGIVKCHFEIGAGRENFEWARP